jgi:alpha/beta superfamily hydrolase
MKKIFTIVILIINYQISSSQEITGTWNGILKVQGMQLRLVFKVTKSENGYSSTIDSPDQGAKNIPVTNTTFENSKIKFEVTNAKIEYNGELSDTKIIGTFKQGSQEFPMNLSKNPLEKEILKRPQEPTKPYSYYSEDVTFQNTKANISLSGTLTLPKKNGFFPSVILITGSGPQNRNEELLGHKPFLVISDYLTKKGIAVLRYDDRGIGDSKGNFKTATTVDFATDVESAINYLQTRKEINKNKIGLVGHSEGGLIASIVASKSKDISFIVLLAGTGIQGDKLLLLQQKLISRAKGISETDIKKSNQTNVKLFEIVIQSNDNQKLKTDLTNHIKETLKSDTSIEIPNGLTKEEFISIQVNQISNPWIQYFIKFNPATVLEKVKCPVLAVNGEKDLQVPSKENLTAIKNALKIGGNENVTIKEFPRLNHLFQECKTGLPNEYAKIEQTFSPIVLTEISNWILNQIK